MEIKKEDISLLQENLSAIRSVAKWTTEQLANKIDVSKQTVSNLENQKAKMSELQYVLIRSVIDQEIMKNTNNDRLKKVVNVLLNQDEYKKEDAGEEIRTFLQKEIGTKVSTEQIYGLSKSLLSIPLIGAGIAGIWIAKYLNSKD